MSRIIILGEAWGSNEAAERRPFVGATGRDLNDLLQEANLLPFGSASTLNRALWSRNFDYRDEIFRANGIHLTNVFNLQPPSNKIENLCGPRQGSLLPPIRPGKYIRLEFASELERLKAEIAKENPNLIIGMGATALWFLLGTSAITKRRGTVALSPYGKCISTFHPAYLMRGMQHLRPIVLFDLIKAQRESEFAEVHRPERFVHIPENLSDIEELLGTLRQADRLSIDIETAGDQITCIGFAWNKQHALVIPIFDTSKPDRSYWSPSDEPVIWDCIRNICVLPMPKVFQNGLYDLHFLWRRYGIAPSNCEHDTMLLHHALYPEMQKGLGFMGSLYTNEASWKLMRLRGKETTLKDLKEE